MQSQEIEGSLGFGRVDLLRDQRSESSRIGIANWLDILLHTIVGSGGREVQEPACATALRRTKFYLSLCA
jgi:hypothetical protein